MYLYSTNDKNHVVTLKEAVFKGLPPDNGLYMPSHIPLMHSSFFESIEQMTFGEISYEVSRALIGNYIAEGDLKKIVSESITFDAPVVPVNDHTYALELFHGPTLAFKDFGARFMAKLIGYFLDSDKKNIHILVATSGDTGGAVAAGFYNVPGVRVSILYPSGKVSTLQEKQLTTLGNNIQAFEVNGTFDDCQKIVKQAFLDQELSKKVNLSSANSINIARLIPQSFYYYWAYKQLKKHSLPLVFCTPSGNFGNIFAGIMAHKMGLPVHRFIAAVNANDTFANYIHTGVYSPKPSVSTLSNAMDVGNPSNFARINHLFGYEVNNVRHLVSSYSFDDAATLQTIINVHEQHHYLLDPHGAVAYLGIEAYKKQHSTPANYVLLHTAHPAKFIDVYPDDLKKEIKIPQALSSLAHKEKKAVYIDADYTSFKQVFEKSL